MQWGEHYAALSRLAVRQTLMVNQLVDMEWKFGGNETNHSVITEGGALQSCLLSLSQLIFMNTEAVV